MLNLDEYFCAFSWLDGSYKRYFQLKADGRIEDLYGSDGHDNERFWQIQNNELILISRDHQPTSLFKITEQWGGENYLLSGSTLNQNVKLRLYCVRKPSDLFEHKTKFIHRHNVQNGWLSVGDNTYGNVSLIDIQYGKVEIGDYCSIADARFIVGYHRTDLVTTFPFQVLNQFYSHHTVSTPDHYSKGTIIVGNDVWIGLNATILSGVKIGDGAVIAANSVVAKDVEPYSIVGGNPARHLKYRFEDENQRKQLLEIAWWNWSEEKVAENINKIISSDISAFIDEFKSKIE